MIEVEYTNSLFALIKMTKKLHTLDGGLKRIFIYGLKLDDTVKISIPSYLDVTLKAVNSISWWNLQPLK